MGIWLMSIRHIMRTFDAAQVAQLRVAPLGRGDVRPVQRAQASQPRYDLRTRHNVPSRTACCTGRHMGDACCKVIRRDNDVGY